MQIPKILALALVLTAISTTPAPATTVKEYREMIVGEGGRRWIEVYIRGYGSGLGWANAELQGQNRPMLFCAPSQIVLNAENYLDLLNRRIKDAGDRMATEKLESMHIEIILLDALRRDFPCSNEVKH